MTYYNFERNDFPLDSIWFFYKMISFSLQIKKTNLSKNFDPTKPTVEFWLNVLNSIVAMHHELLKIVFYYLIIFNIIFDFDCSCWNTYQMDTHPPTGIDIWLYDINILHIYVLHSNVNKKVDKKQDQYLLNIKCWHWWQMTWTLAYYHVLY